MSDTLPPRSGVLAHLVVAGADKAAAFYAQAFGAEEVFRMPAEDKTRLMHCQMRLNGGVLMLADDFPEYHGGQSSAPAEGRASPVTLHMQVENCDAAYDRAIAAGAATLMPPADMFWGDRYAQVKDPFGHHWSLAHTLPKA